MLFIDKKSTLNITHLNAQQKLVQKRLQFAQKSFAPSSINCKSLCKAFAALSKKSNKNKGVVYVLDFVGDIKASAVDKLREELSAVLSYAKKDDEIVLRLESSGGQVHAYGLAAAQLARVRQKGIALTVCVDKVAASGGYMMACVADNIIAAPFAIIGSIGVVSQIPNFHEFLKKHDINIELFTAGEYKRTVTIFGENSDEDRQKHQQDLERIHTLFSNHITTYRPNIAINTVNTGEFWFATDAVDKNLVDNIGTSDAFLLEKMDKHNLLHVSLQKKPSIWEKIGAADRVGRLDLLIEQGIDGAKNALLSSIQNKHIR